VGPGEGTTEILGFSLPRRSCLCVDKNWRRENYHVHGLWLWQWLSDPQIHCPPPTPTNLRPSLLFLMSLEMCSQNRLLLLNLIGTKLVFNCCLRYALSFEAFSNLWGHKPTLTHKIILK